MPPGQQQIPVPSLLQVGEPQPEVGVAGSNEASDCARMPAHPPPRTPASHRRDPVSDTAEPARRRNLAPEARLTPGISGTVDCKAEPGTWASCKAEPGTWASCKAEPGT